jgi:hypothetical protein
MTIKIEIRKAIEYLSNKKVNIENHLKHKLEIKFQLKMATKRRYKVAIF